MTTITQKTIIRALRADNAFQVLLGHTASAPGSVQEEAGFNMDGIVYPLITVDVNTVYTMPSQQVRTQGSKYHIRFFADIRIFTKGSTSSERGIIELALIKLMETSPFATTDGFCVKDCHLETILEADRDSETGFWTEIIRFQLSGKLT